MDKIILVMMSTRTTTTLILNDNDTDDDDDDAIGDDYDDDDGDDDDVEIVIRNGNVRGNGQRKGTILASAHEKAFFSIDFGYVLYTLLPGCCQQLVRTCHCRSNESTADRHQRSTMHSLA